MNKKSLFIIFLLVLPLYTCANIDNPISFMLSNNGQSIEVNNENISNLKSISIDTSKITIKKNEEKLLIAVLTNKDGTIDYSNNKVEWVSQDKEIVEVDETGKIKGVSAGETGVIVKHKEESKYFRFIIKVEEVASTPTPKASISSTPTPSKTPATILFTPFPSSTPIKTSTPTPKATVTPKITPTPKVTATPTNNPTPTSTTTVTPTPTSTPTPTPTVEETISPEVTPEPSSSDIVN